MSKFKLSPTEAQDTIDLFYKLTGQKIKTPEKLEQVHNALVEYVKKQIKIHA